MRRALYATPFLFSLASILHLWAKNADETDLGVVLPWLGLTVLAAAAIFGLAWAILRNPTRAAAVASLLIALATTYGHAGAALLRKGLASGSSTANAIVGVVWAALAVAGSVFLARTKRDLERGLGAAAAFSLIVCVFTLFRWGSDHGASTADPEMNAKVARLAAGLEAPIPATRAPEPKPDIYYLIVDGYARADVLRAGFGHDNGPFLEELRKRGFWIAEKSRANFPITFLSLASSLSLTPLDGIAAELGPDSSERRPFVKMTRGNRASRFLKANGYRYATILTNYYATEASETADTTWSYLPRLLRSEFAQAYLRTSVACLVEPSLAASHRHAFRSIEEAGRLEGPTFLFAHLILPHPPYVFRRDGTVRKNVPLSFQWREANKDDGSYVEQLLYLNGRLLELIDGLLKSAPTPPVIIVQGDHGWVAPGTPEAEQASHRIPILNAYLVPDGVRSKLYPDITPVNSFRVLFSELFGADLPRVPDRSYMCDYAKACDLRDVTDEVVRAWAPEK